MDNNNKKGSFLGLVPLFCFLVVYFVMGTVTALAPIAIEIAPQIGVSLPVICGAVVGGAMFGDNLSFISDTTIAATTTQGCEMKDKFKANFLMVLPAVICTCIIILSLIGVNVVVAMGASVVLGMIIGIAKGDFSFVESFGIIFILIGFPKMVYKPRENKAVDAE